jgi:hypothetical protein
MENGIYTDISIEDYHALNLISLITHLFKNENPNQYRDKHTGATPSPDKAVKEIVFHRLKSLTT